MIFSILIYLPSYFENRIILTYVYCCARSKITLIKLLYSDFAFNHPCRGWCCTETSKQFRLNYSSPNNVFEEASKLIYFHYTSERSANNIAYSSHSQILVNYLLFISFLSIWAIYKASVISAKYSLAAICISIISSTKQQQENANAFAFSTTQTFIRITIEQKWAIKRITRKRNGNNNNNKNN